jgi:hypothetical protein
MRIMIGLILLLGIFFGFSSCDEDDEVIGVVYYPVIVTHTVGCALDYNTSGLDFMASMASIVVNESLIEPKDVYTYDADVVRSWDKGWSSTNYEYIGTSVEEGIDYNADFSIDYESQYMISEDEAMSEGLIKNISDRSNYFRLSGESTRTCMQYSKTYDDSFESTVVLTFEDLEVNRVIGKIKEGIVKYTYNGKSSYGETYTSSGEIIYSDYLNMIVVD